jgi:hypothetical protein
MKLPRHGKPGSERGAMFDSEGAIPKGNPHQLTLGAAYARIVRSLDRKTACSK